MLRGKQYAALVSAQFSHAQQMLASGLCPSLSASSTAWRLSRSSPRSMVLNSCFAQPVRAACQSVSLSSFGRSGLVCHGMG